jgi:hypothetical protein
VSKTSTLAKLQTLLERVRARSSMPRNGQAGPAAAASPEPEVEAAPPATPIVVATAVVASVPELPPLIESVTLPVPSADEAVAEEISVEIEMSEMETQIPPPPISLPVSPPADLAAPPAPAPPPAPSAPILSATPGPLPFESAPPSAGPLPFESIPPATAHPPPAIAESAATAGSESAERLVAAERVAAEPPIEIAPARPVEAPPAEIHAAAAPVTEPESQAQVPPPSLPEEAGEIPAAPASSRRPVAAEPEERLADMAFGSEEPAQPPRHTPPPESGRLPAAPVEEFDADVTGVRHAPHAEAARAADEMPTLAPVEMRAPLSPSEAVGQVVGAPLPFEPATFIAWLDATLDL